jgi:hypothetical protein
MGLNQSCPNQSCPPCESTKSTKSTKSYRYRYGVKDNWAYLENSSPSAIKCSNETFGGDPAPGKPKNCYFQKTIFGGAKIYLPCAEENGTCSIPK